MIEKSHPNLPHPKLMLYNRKNFDTPILEALSVQVPITVLPKDNSLRHKMGSLEEYHTSPLCLGFIGFK